MNKVLLDLGIIQINWYSFFIFIAMATAVFLVFKESKKKDLDQDTLVDIIFYVLVFGILGARLYYVLFNLDYYLKNPLEIIQIWHGGLAIHGGIIAGLIVTILYSKKKKLKLPLLTDIIVPGLIIGQAIGRWGNFFNQEAFGRIVKLSTLEKMHLPNFIIEGMHINGFYREPTFLYESVMSIIGFIILLLVRKSKKIKTGQLTSIYLVWYGIIRLIIEGLRSDSLMLGPLKIAQIVSIVFIITGIIIFIKNRNNQIYIDDKININTRRKVCTKK